MTILNSHSVQHISDHLNEATSDSSSVKKWHSLNNDINDLENQHNYETWMFILTPSMFTECLCYLLGESCLSLSHQYRLGPCTIGRIIKTTTKAIFDEFHKEYLEVGFIKYIQRLLNWRISLSEIWSKFLHLLWYLHFSFDYSLLAHEYLFMTRNG